MRKESEREKKTKQNMNNSKHNKGNTLALLNIEIIT